MKILSITLLLAAAFVSTLHAQTPEEKVSALEKRVAALEKTVQILFETIARPQPASAGNNKTGIPDSVLAKIKAKVAAQYPEDFAMQKILIDSEVKAYKEINQ